MKDATELHCGEYDPVLIQHSCHNRITVITSFPLVNRIHITIQIIITTQKAQTYPTWH